MTGALQLLKLPAPVYVISLRQLHAAFNDASSFRYKSRDVAALDVKSDADATLAILAADLSRPFFLDNVC
jgi:hypothetical protein